MFMHIRVIMCMPPVLLSSASSSMTPTVGGRRAVRTGYIVNTRSDTSLTLFGESRGYSTPCPGQFKTPARASANVSSCCYARTGRSRALPKNGHARAHHYLLPGTMHLVLKLVSVVNVKNHSSQQYQSLNQLM